MFSHISVQPFSVTRLVTQSLSHINKTCYSSSNTLYFSDGKMLTCSYSSD